MERDQQRRVRGNDAPDVCTTRTGLLAKHIVQCDKFMKLHIFHFFLVMINNFSNLKTYKRTTAKSNRKIDGQQKNTAWLETEKPAFTLLLPEWLLNTVANVLTRYYRQRGQ